MSEKLAKTISVRISLDAFRRLDHYLIKRKLEAGERVSKREFIDRVITNELKKLGA